MTETNDGTNGFILTLASPNPQPAHQHPYARSRFDHIPFPLSESRQPPPGVQLLQGGQLHLHQHRATGQSFVFENATNFITATRKRRRTARPSRGLIPLRLHDNFDAAELSDPNTNGCPSGRNTSPAGPSQPELEVLRRSSARLPPRRRRLSQHRFRRTYRLESAFSLKTPGPSCVTHQRSGGSLMFTDLRTEGRQRRLLSRGGLLMAGRRHFGARSFASHAASSVQPRKSCQSH